MRVVVSTESVDRDREIILLSAWAEMLDIYRKAPVLCWHHPLSKENPQPEDVLGKAIAVTLTDQALICDFQYAVEVNPKAAFCWAMRDYLQSYSIGAIVWDGVYWWDEYDQPEKFAALPRNVQLALSVGACDFVVTKAELVEVSKVIVGSNRDAQEVLRALGAGLISKSLAAQAFSERSTKMEDDSEACADGVDEASASTKSDSDDCECEDPDDCQCDEEKSTKDGDSDMEDSAKALEALALAAAQLGSVILLAGKALLDL